MEGVRPMSHKDAVAPPVRGLSQSGLQQQNHPFF